MESRVTRRLLACARRLILKARGARSLHFNTIPRAECPPGGTWTALTKNLRLVTAIMFQKIPYIAGFFHFLKDS